MPDKKPCYLYWIRRKSHTDITKEGYIGITYNFENRLRQHLNNCKNTKYHHRNYRSDFRDAVITGDYIASVILIGSRQYCLDLEKTLRPNWVIGWNIAKGGSGGYGRHGLSGTKVKSIYYNLKAKAEDTGEEFCESWLGKNGLTNFYNFYKSLPEGGVLQVIKKGCGYNPNNLQKVSRSDLIKSTHAKYKLSDGKLYSIIELGEMFNIKPNTISTRLSRGWSLKESLGISKKRRYVEYCYEKEMAIHYLWNSPMTHSRISKLVGLNKSCLRRQLSNYKIPNWLFTHFEVTSFNGMTARRLPRCRFFNCFDDFSTILDIECMYESGTSEECIAKELNISETVVRKLLEELGNAKVY